VEKIIDMYRILLFAVMISLTSAGLHGQKNDASVDKGNGCKCGFQSLFQAGILEGVSGPSWNIQTINGTYYKTWFAGIGLGLDHYTMRTIPLFLDIRKELLRRTRTPFLYADGGIHFDWLKTKEKPGWGSSDYDRRFYYDLGAGYKIGFGRRDALLVSAGYTMKTLREEREVIIQCVAPPCNASNDYYSYTFSRLTFKVGWQFR
jgi:hypothetical protein